MGREIRRIPGDWQHPREMRRWGAEDYKPLHDSSYADDVKKFMDKAKAEGLAAAVSYFGSAPDPEDYFPDWPAESRTHWAVYETVSEGTPVTPAFATADELIAYLAANGDFWDQKRGHGGWGEECARRFVAAGWAPSLMIVNGKIHDASNLPEAFP